MSQHWITWAQSLILHIQQKAFLDLILNHTNYESFMTTISLSDESQITLYKFRYLKIDRTRAIELKALFM